MVWFVSIFSNFNFENCLPWRKLKILIVFHDKNRFYILNFGTHEMFTSQRSLHTSFAKSFVNVTFGWQNHMMPNENHFDTQTFFNFQHLAWLNKTMFQTTNLETFKWSSDNRTTNDNNNNQNGIANANCPLKRISQRFPTTNLCLME